MYRLSTLAREAGLRGLFAGLVQVCDDSRSRGRPIAIYGAVKDGESLFTLPIQYNV